MNSSTSKTPQMALWQAGQGTQTASAAPTPPPAPTPSPSTADLAAALTSLLAQHRLAADIASGERRQNERDAKALAALWHFHHRIVHAADLPAAIALDSMLDAIAETQRGILTQQLELVDGAGV